MTLDILHPEQSEHHIVDWVEINTPVGSYVIQPGHAPMVATLAENQELVYKSAVQPGVQKITVERGVVTISRTGVVVLLGKTL